MSDNSSTGGLLTPGSRAVAALVLACAALMGQNLLTTGIQFLVTGPGGGDPRQFALVLGVAAATPALLALGLALPQARTGVTGWPTPLAGAAVVVAGVALVGAALAVLGALLHGTF